MVLVDVTISLTTLESGPEKKNSPMILWFAREEFYGMREAFSISFFLFRQELNKFRKRVMKPGSAISAARYHLSHNSRLQRSQAVLNLAWT